MIKQEEIFYILQDIRLGNLSEYEATLKLQELGVVVKVYRELPFPGEKLFARLNYQVEPMNPIRGSVIEAYRMAQQDMGEAGYVAVEPLIREVKNERNNS